MIHTQGLRYSYAGSPPLCFADVHVPQGGTLVLHGRSGSGKSTWLSLAAGLLQPEQGRIVVADAQPACLKPSQRDPWRARTLGFLPQRLHLSKALTVQKNLALVYFAAGLPEDRHAIFSALQSLEVEKLAQRKPSQLSVGQAQRVALARALLLSPRVILADEPTASLDDASATAALQLLQSHSRRCQATLVIATHDRRVHQALEHAQRYDMDTAALPIAASVT